MSTLVLEHLKHTNASSNNITLAADGSLTLAGTSVTGDLTVDTNTLKVDATNNRVGVGTASPSDALHVKGFTQVESTAGDAAYIRFNNTVNSGGKTWRAGAGVSSHGSFSIYNQTDNKFGMTVTDEGYVKQPNRPFFFAYPNEGTGSHNATSEWTGMGGTHYDNGSNFSGARFTAPVTGYYFFIAWFQEETYYGSWNSPISIFWYKNGSLQFYYGNDNPGIQDAYSEMKIGNSVITYLAENDTFSAALRTPNGSPSTEYNSGGVQGWLIS